MFFRIFLIFLVFFGSVPAWVHACALPPDVLHEFQLHPSDTETTIRYRLLAWRHLHPEIQRTLEKEIRTGVQAKDFWQKFQTHLTTHTTLTIDGAPISLTFLTGSIRTATSTEQEHTDPYTTLPEVWLEAVFSTDAPLRTESVHEVQ